ncbi:MAG: glycosyltransferase family 2 protein [Betaproteobacteria bacterium]|nr:glycosyltransferase family 2 protein [Betaproteobacteria bacterium]
MKLSVIVITKNEAAAIGRCLDSVAWADEIIVLDSGSDDETVALARSRGARVETATDWPGFGPQKNRALALARGDWVLSLDADEWVTEALAEEIRGRLESPDNAVAFEVPRSSRFCGREMRHSGWWPDYIVRLFRRDRARFSDDIVHEKVIVDGRVARLAVPLQHESFVSLHEVVDKMNRYSTAGAQMRISRGKGGSIGGAVGHGLWAFLRTYVFRAGFLDGREGFVLAVANAEGTYYRYLKAWLAARDRRT